jgi:DNA-binding transcriptional regulator YiaG
MTVKDVLLVAEARELCRSGTAAEIREAAALSQSEIARAIGVTPAAVCRWEGGTRLPRGEPAKRLALLLRALRAAPTSSSREYVPAMGL